MLLLHKIGTIEHKLAMYCTFVWCVDIGERKHFAQSMQNYLSTGYYLLVLLQYIIIIIIEQRVAFPLQTDNSIYIWYTID